MTGAQYHAFATRIAFILKRMGPLKQRCTCGAAIDIVCDDGLPFRMALTGPETKDSLEVRLRCASIATPTVDGSGRECRHERYGVALFDEDTLLATLDVDGTILADVLIGIVYAEVMAVANQFGIPDAEQMLQVGAHLTVTCNEATRQAIVTMVDTSGATPRMTLEFLPLESGGAGRCDQCGVADESGDMQVDVAGCWWCPPCRAKTPAWERAGC